MSKHTHSQLLNFKTTLELFPHCFPRKFVEVYKISLKEFLSNEFKTACTDTEF